MLHMLQRCELYIRIIHKKYLNFILETTLLNWYIYIFMMFHTVTVNTCNIYSWDYFERSILIF